MPTTEMVAFIVVTSSIVLVPESEDQFILDANTKDLGESKVVIQVGEIEHFFDGGNGTTIIVLKSGERINTYCTLIDVIQKINVAQVALTIN